MSERRDVIRTKQLIEHAYYELLFKKGDEKITVQNILDEANISRGTFYAHYRDIPDLTEQVEKEIILSIKDCLSHATLNDILENPKEQVSAMISGIITHKEELRVLLTNVDKPQSIQKMKYLFMLAIDADSDYAISKDHPSNKEALAASQRLIVKGCMAGVIFDACYYWIMSDDAADVELLTDTISDFLSGGLQKVVTKNHLL